MTVWERFLDYIRYETTSDEDSASVPSTPGQLTLGKRLADELQALGLSNVRMEKGYVYALLPANIETSAPVLGLIAHIDTAPDWTTRGINPRMEKSYGGGDIVLNPAGNVVLSPRDFPALLGCVGEDLIVTDGTTLLGADDKAGVAEIMSALEHLVNNPSIAHGTIAVAFTPDEEIGRGADEFDVAGFGARFAYTVDGGQTGELEYESFNAANAKLIFHGRNVHPGTAKNRMVNSMEVAQELHALLPREQRPQYTEGYEGFYHLTSFEGSVDETKTTYIVRDHDRTLFERRKAVLRSAVDFTNLKYGAGTVELDMQDRYYNMGEKIKEAFFLVDIAKEAMQEVGIEPIIKPIRGGTDGSRLSFMGLPCPNLFTGGHNFHGRYEFISTQAMEKAVQVILGIVQRFAKLEL